MAWAYERDQHSSQIPEYAVEHFDWYGDDESVADRPELKPSINLIKKSVDTLVSWLFTDIPAVEVRASGTVYESRRAVEARSQALDSLFNTPAAGRVLRAAGRDALLKGTAHVCPRLIDGKIQFQRIHDHQVNYDPFDSRDGKPTWVAFHEYVDRDSWIAWYRQLKDIPKHKERIQKIRDIPRADAKLLNEGIVGPYDAFLDGSDLVNGSDQILIQHHWRRASYPGADDGRYVCTIHGGGVGYDDLGGDGGLVAIDRMFPRTTLPVITFSPWPQDAGMYGIGLGAMLKGWQFQLDLAFFRISRKLLNFGDDKIVLQRGNNGSEDDVAAQFIEQGINVLFVDNPGEIPNFIKGQSLAQEELGWIQTILSLSSTHTGINELLAQGGSQLGAGASMVAMVEETFRSKDRFSDVVSQFDDFRLRLASETLNAKDDAVALDPNFRAHFTDHRERGVSIKWSELTQVNGDYNVQLEATGILGRSRSGRIASSVDLAARGVLDPEIAKDLLLSSPDLRRAAKLSTAAMRFVEMQLEDIVEGKPVVPDEDTPLELALDMSQRYIHSSILDGADDTVVQRLREYKAIVAALIQAKTAPPPGPAPGPGAGLPGIPELSEIPGAPTLDDLIEAEGAMSE
jgi:hypothetical protein